MSSGLALALSCGQFGDPGADQGVGTHSSELRSSHPGHSEDGARNDVWEDIAQDPGSGLAYARAPSTTKAIFDAQKEASVAEPPTPYTPADFVVTPEKSNGAPGVAILDFDRDGDQDLYVTNGPGHANSLFSNQLKETGETTFVDVAIPAGADASAQDSTGVCFGDIDNDGDEDIYVLGRMEANVLLENQGDGTFTDITSSAGVGGGALGHTSCSFGDVNGDGLLDVVVANSFDWTNRLAIFVLDFDASQPNQLFVNRGSNAFTDESVSSGLQDLRGFSDGSEDRPTITWGIGLADVDLDGDVDIVQADDQAAKVNQRFIDPATGQPGIDRGFMHLLINDGTGHFSDVTPEAGLARPGQWMGVTFGDYDCDGEMDFFGTNMGGYAFSVLPIQFDIADTNNRWFLGQPDMTWADPDVGDLVSDPFGWGPSSLDYDNDGDTDIMYFGSLDGTGPVGTADNPGVLLSNDGCRRGKAEFSANLVSLSGTDHRRRNVNGSAVGDLNNDGFDDIVSVSASDYFDAPLVDYPVNYGGPYDDTAAFFPAFRESTPGSGEFIWNEFEQTHGTLSVQLNSATSGNNWIRVRTLGTVGLIDGGRANRDGIGAVITLSRKRRPSTMRPVVGGSNHASQDSTDILFGLGRSRRGTIDVLWPGGVHNRLYNARAGKTVVFPEIPCDFKAPSRFWRYHSCVTRAIHQLKGEGILSRREALRFKISAIRAFFDERAGHR